MPGSVRLILENTLHQTLLLLHLLEICTPALAISIRTRTLARKWASGDNSNQHNLPTSLSEWDTNDTRSVF
jgi:hypothetical protein